MAWIAIALFSIQSIVLLLFCFFGVFNALYGFASLRRPSIRRTKHSGRQIAVVVVSFNEKHVLENTIRACETLTYRNKLIVMADDSTDSDVVESLREVARAGGCRKVTEHGCVQEITGPDGSERLESIEIWEGPGLVLLHRPQNVGFKAGSIRNVEAYLRSRNIELMYLLDADWRPQRDALERCLEVLEADERVAFVQTKRLAVQDGLNRFQRCVAINEEGCYRVDFQGRQVLGHPILFSGCCTLLRMDAVANVGGFTSGHLTEDLDLTDRLWLKGWKGVYLNGVVNHGEVPFTFDHFRRQQERWAAGSARCLRRYFWPIIRCREMSTIQKLSAIRQNSYFATSVLTAFALAIGIGTVLWLTLGWNTYQVEFYLYLAESVRIPFTILVWACVLSNFVEPLVSVLFKKRDYWDILHLPLTLWYAWGVLHTYVMGNAKGFFGRRLDWFRTPKIPRRETIKFSPAPVPIRFVNLITLIVLIALYFTEGWSFAWKDYFALLWVPAFLLAVAK